MKETSKDQVYEIITKDQVYEIIKQIRKGETKDVVDKLKEIFPRMRKEAIEHHARKHLKELKNEKKKIVTGKDKVQRKGRYGTYKVEATVWALPGILDDEKAGISEIPKDSIKVGSKITSLKWGDEFKYDLQEENLDHRQHIPIEITPGNKPFNIWRVYLQRKRGLSLTTVKEYLVDQELIDGVISIP